MQLITRSRILQATVVEGRPGVKVTERSENTICPHRGYLFDSIPAFPKQLE